MRDEYIRQAEVVRVIDGDSVVLQIDAGFRMAFIGHCRLYGIDAPELREPGGKEARAALSEMLAAMGDRVTVKTYKPDKFGRYLVTIYTDSVQDNAPTVNQRMVMAGYAKAYDGGQR